MALTEVPPPTRPTLKVVFGWRGHLEGVDFGDGAAHGLYRVRHAERAVAVAAGPFEGHLVAVAAHADVRDAEPGAVHRDELIDLSLEAVEEEALHAAQIAQPFLADIRDERDGAGSFHVAVIQRADYREHDGQSAAIVADARRFEDVALARDFDVGAFGEDGVEVRGEYQVGVRGLAGPDADHVAGRVDAYVAQTQFLEEALQLLPADGFLEGRRGNFAEPGLQAPGCAARCASRLPWRRAQRRPYSVRQAFDPGRRLPRRAIRQIETSCF